MNPEQLLLEHQDFLARLARCAGQRKGLKPEEIEDFTQNLNVKLIENDYRVLRQYQGKAKFKSYLTVVVQRFLLDYLNHLWGKWRPSKAADRMGKLAVRLETLTIRDGHPLATAIRFLIENQKVETTEAELEATAEKLPTRYKRRIEPDDQLERLPSESDSAEELVQRREWSADGERIHSAMAEVLQELPDEDALIVKLGCRMSVADISRTLGLEQKPLYRRRKLLLEQVREKLEAKGIDRELIRQYLNDGESFR